MAVRAQPSVYLIESDPVERDRVVGALAGHVREVVTFANGREFLAHPPVDVRACIVVSLKLPDMPTHDFVAAAGTRVPIIVLGHVEELSTAVELIRAGATDVLDRPCDARRLRAAVRAAALGRGEAANVAAPSGDRDDA